MTQVEKALIYFVLESLRNCPEDWTADEFRVRHKTRDITVWIANDYYGIHVEGKNYYIGGVNQWSTMFGRFIPWRRNMFNAALKIYKKSLPDSQLAIEKVLAA